MAYLVSLNINAWHVVNMGMEHTTAEDLGMQIIIESREVMDRGQKKDGREDNRK